MKAFEIKYKCMHPSCVVNCRDGVLAIEEDTFARLKACYAEDNLFRSPKGFCRLGFNQAYRVVTIKTVVDSVMAKDAEDSLREKVGDPMRMLMDDHKEVIKVLATMEEQMRRRDVEGLWVSTADLENKIMLHSIKKEEDVLFPMLGELLPLGDGLVSIIKEDHRELVTLMHSFRTGLAVGNILDGLGQSILINLRSHTRKEDNEFFTLIDKALTDGHRKTLLEGYRTAEATFTPIVADEESRERARQSALAQNRDAFDAEVMQAIEEARASAGGCCH